MDYLNRSYRPEEIKPVAALSEADAITAGLIEKRLTVAAIVDPANPATTVQEQMKARNEDSTRANFAMACPSVVAPRAERLAWLKSSVQRGSAFLQSQPNYDKLLLSSQILQGIVNDGDVEPGMSTVHVNHIKRQVKEIISVLSSNLAPEIKYGEEDEDSAELQGLVEYFNKKYASWWKGNTFPAKKIEQVLQYAVMGVGYIAPVWKNEIFSSAAADVDFKVYNGLEDVFIDQGTEDWDEQNAYAITTYERVPTLRMRQAWPEQAHFIMPSVLGIDEVGMKAKGTEANNRVSSSVSQNPIMSMLSGNDGIGNAKSKGFSGGVRSRMTSAGAYFTDVYITYIADSSYNASGKLLKASEITETDGMHLPGITRDYLIPPVDVAVSLTEPTENDPDPKKQTYSSDRCRLYPSRRVIIWTPDHILYDGPSFYHHSMVPLVKFQLDPMVWSYSGGNLIEDIRKMSSALNTMLRGWVDSLTVRLDPPVQYDESEIAAGVFEKLSLRKAGVWLKRTGASMIKRAIEPILPYEHYNVANQITPFLEFIINRMNHVLGTEDFSSLARLQQLPDADGIEKIMAANGPLIASYATNMEQAMTKLGYQLMWMWAQFDTTANKLLRGSVNSLLTSEFDDAPGNMIPSTVQFGDALTNSSFFYRLRATLKRIGFKIVPQSIFAVTDWKRKMMTLQLFREPNFPMDSQTLANVMGLENFGTIPGNTIYERWINEKKARIPFEAGLGVQAMQTQLVGQAVGQVQAQVAAQQLMAELQQGVAQGQIDPQMALTLLPLLLEAGSQQSSGATPPSLEFSPETLTSYGQGRPPTAQQAPNIELKSNGDGTRRTTVTES